jgi:hypothetical protein
MFYYQNKLFLFIDYICNAKERPNMFLQYIKAQNATQKRVC